MWPWMVMNYKNKSKANSSDSGGKGKVTHGSRFALLQDSEEDIVETPLKEAIEFMKETSSELKIVQFWKQVQKKTLKINAGNSKSSTTLNNNGNMVNSTPLTDIQCFSHYEEP